LRRICAAIPALEALALSALSTGALPPLARARDRPLADAITVANADPCLASVLLAGAVERWLGRDRIDERLAALVVLGREGRAADLVLTRGDEIIGLRRFDALPAACSDRRSMLALALALAIDAALLEELARRHAPAAAGAPASAAPNRSRHAIALGLAIEGGLSLGLPWELAGIASALVGLRIDGVLRLDLGALGTSTVAVPLDGGRADITLVGGRAHGCLVTGLAPIELAGCVGVAAAAALAAGRGFLRNHSTEIPWVAGLARLEVSLTIADPLTIGLAFDGLFGLVRPRLDVLGPDGISSDSRVLPAASIAIAVAARARFR
jgi:hypothetical protein